METPPNYLNTEISGLFLQPTQPLKTSYRRNYIITWIPIRDLVNEV
jgi:hypothetical protein